MIYSIKIYQSENITKIQLDDELGNEVIEMHANNIRVHNLIEKYHHNPIKIQKYNPLFKAENPQYKNKYFAETWYGELPNIQVTGEIAKENGYPELIKIDIWVKGADDRFFDIHPTHTNVWAYVNIEHSEALIALCDAKTQKPIERLWDEKLKTPKGAKKKLTQKEHNI